MNGTLKQNLLHTKNRPGGPDAQLSLLYEILEAG